MNILALDLGTKTGWATGTACGTWTLATSKELKEHRKRRGDRRCDIRVLRLWAEIAKLHGATPFDWIVFEDVRFSLGLMQAHLWASFRTVAWLFAAHNVVEIECIDTSRLKRFATRHGNAPKDLMSAWLVKTHADRFRFFDGAVREVDNNKKLDDNAVDAAHLYYWAKLVLKNE